MEIILSIPCGYHYKVTDDGKITPNITFAKK